MNRASCPRILSLLGCYWPGNEATGPSQSFRAFATGLQGDFDIRVVARDGTGTTSVDWQTGDLVPRAQLAIGRFGARGLLQLLRDTPHDLLFLNGFHDREFTIPALVLRKLGLIPRKPTILSPRGEFAQGALSLKPGKKRLYQRGVRLAGLTRDIWLHATADHERQDIEASGLACRGILQAPNVRLLPDLPDVKPPASLGKLRIAFVGRISPVKNLEFALDVLAKASVPVVLDVYGPMVDPDYWTRLQARICRMPDSVTVTAHGALPHDRVASTLAAHDLFFLPTMGENFGHAINEALGAGLPALIADTTPWRGLQAAGAGWDLPLARPELFSAAIEEMARASAQQRQAMRTAARRFAEDSFAASDAVAANRRMLNRLLDKRDPCVDDI
ncbi:hypothetical protein DQW77_16125 [Roseovarius sp. TE539]|uniref:glycosyltransferase family 4 protein n=1 Tax=Roseovarius sp. TE539 TaxID=2249812 RepID=UPI000DE190E5|nr:glycosyltransferase family 4 protein [Roseovarius sp. TE539]RBI69002.1 hypothetical protein DQW77_16125 [Roseovarius sp. TE539]